MAAPIQKVEAFTLDEIAAKVSVVISESLAGVPLAAADLDQFSSSFAVSYVALLSERNYANFSRQMRGRMSSAILAGLSVERILAAIDSAGALIRALRPGQRTIISFATSIAKTVAAQAYIDAANTPSP